MVLLHVLALIAKSQGWKLVVAHFNHQLRGRSSAADERFVKRAAGKLGLTFHTGRGDVKALSRKDGVSIEMAARELRHAFLATIARQTSCRVVALAHHADDQVELFFLRLLRGAGGEGLAGMKWKTRSPSERKLALVRPFLNLEKSTLAAFANQAQVRFREDASNRSADILRNRVRLELLPLLRRRFHPAVDISVARLMEIVGRESEVVSALAERWLATNPRSVPMTECPIAVQRRIIQQQMQQLGWVADFDLIESLRLEPGKTISVAPEVWLAADINGLVKKVSLPIHAFNAQSTTVQLGKSAGECAFSGMTFLWEFRDGESSRPGRNLPGLEMFDADKIGGKIVLRHWRAGDRFQPIGMKTSVKLQDWFTNLKISAAQRRALVLATTERGEIFWVEGVRIGEQFKLGDATRRRLVWRWFRQ